jgi:phosphatidylinositol kinase/protein kinase (PI-3  family)
MQVLRTFNGLMRSLAFDSTLTLRHRMLSCRKESRKRNLGFHLPAAIPCSPGVRLWQTDASYISFGDIYDQHCLEFGITREDPILLVGEKVKQVLREFKHHQGRTVRLSPNRRV